MRIRHAVVVCLLWTVGLFVAPAAAQVAEHSGTITAQTTWSAEVTHLITGDVTVNADVILNIDPGTVIKFRSGTRLTVNGAMIARGVEGGEIYFTSYRDDEIGGDTNGDGPSYGRPGDWEYIRFSSTVAADVTKLEHVHVRYAGQGNFTGIYLESAPITFRDGSITDSSAHGLYLTSANALIERNVFARNGLDGIWMQHSYPTIHDNTISENNDGVSVQYSAPDLVGNTIVNNRGWGINYRSSATSTVLSGNTITGNLRPARIPASALPNLEDGNTFVPNQIPALWIYAGTRNSDIRLPVLRDGDSVLRTYYVHNGRLRITDGHTFTVDPGVVMKFGNDSGLQIEGTMNAIGTADEEIVFTSVYDDSYGGDLGANGGRHPARRDWYGLLFSSAEEVNLEHTRVLHAGDNQGAIQLNSTTLNMTHSEIAFSYAQGLYFYGNGNTLTFDNVDIYGCRGDGMYFQSNGTFNGTNMRVFANGDDGIHTDHSAAITITGAIFGNRGHGVRGSGSAVLTAQDVWWGAADGPSGDGPGSGDSIVNQVDASNPRGVGDRYSYLDAGPNNTTGGDLATPNVVQGLPSVEFGTSRDYDLLYDLDQVIVDFGAVNTARALEAILVYHNNDSTANVGGNVQQLLDGNGDLLHGPIELGSSLPHAIKVPIPATAYDNEPLRLQVDKVFGQRAVLAEVYLLERDGGADVPTSSITSPANGDRLAGSTIEVKGQSNAASGVTQIEVGVDGGDGFTWHPVASVDGNNWIFRWSTPVDGTYTLTARALSSSGNWEVAGAGIQVIVDNTAPDAATEVYAYDTPVDAGGRIEVRWTDSASSDVALYRVERKAADEIFYTELGTTVQPQWSDATAVNNVFYTYRIVTEDLTGNRTTSEESAPAQAILNGGADATPPENVTNLSAFAGDGFVQLNWTRSVDSANDLADQLIQASVDGGASWGVVAPNYNDAGAVTVNKLTKAYFFDGLANGTTYRFRVLTRDSSNNVSAGVATDDLTPDANLFNQVSGTISSDTVWSAGVFYVSSDLTINDGATLYIEPGVVVKLKSSVRILVRGGFQAIGTAQAPITITAYADDSVGGDTNKDGPSQGTPGAWERIQFDYADDSVLRHVNIRYAGQGNISSIYAHRSNYELTDVTITDSSSHGIYNDSASPTIRRTVITDCNNEGIYLNGTNGSAPVITDTRVERCSHGLRFSSAGPVLENNTLRDNVGYGIYFNNTTSGPVIRGNTIDGNRTGVRLPFAMVPSVEDGNVIGPNDRDVLEIVGNSRSTSLELGTDHVYYVVSGDASVASGAALTLQPGVIWKSQGRLRIYGGLYAVGTAESPIIMTSYRDDEFGGDTNNNGLSSGAPADWRELRIESTALVFLTRLEHVHTRYGRGLVIDTQRDIVVRNSKFNHHSGNGLNSNNASPTIIDSEFNHNTSLGMYFGHGGSPTLIGNTVSNNGTDGIQSYAPFAAFDDNTVTDNSTWGVRFLHNVHTAKPTGNVITGNRHSMYISARSLPNPEDNNVFAPNEVNGLWIYGDVVSRDLNLSVQQAEVNGPALTTYVINGSLNINNGYTLDIGPGTIFKFSSTSGRLYIYSDATLNVAGTAEQPVYFTSDEDDIGGDINRDGDSNVGQPGQWDHIYIQGTANIDHAHIRYTNDGSSALYFSGATALVRNSIISDSRYDGIQAHSSNLTLENTSVYGNLRRGIYLSNSETTITGGEIIANTSHGIESVNHVSTNVSGTSIFANQGVGFTSNRASTARNVWWGAADGPSGEGSGAGDDVSANVDFADHLQDGRRFLYIDAGPTVSTDGDLVNAPVVAQGTPTTDWGNSPSTRSLYDADEVRLEFDEIAGGSSLEVIARYLNADSASAVGGNRQTMQLGDGTQVHGATAVGASYAQTRRAFLPSVAGPLTLKVVRESGYRTAFSEMWLMESAGSADSDAPISQITSPAPGQSLSGSVFIITGVVADTSALHAVEIGVDSGGGPSWRPVTQWAPDGSFNYRWSLPEDGNYTLYARATDAAGNVEVPAAGVLVTIDRHPPEPVESVGATVTVDGQDTHITVGWSLSPDDGAGDDDVAEYIIERRIEGLVDFDPVGTTAGGADRLVDTTVVAGVPYEYRVITVDDAGNQTPSNAVSSGVATTDGVDATIPADATDLVATAGNASVSLSWTASVDEDLDIFLQQVSVSADGGITWGANAPLFNDGQAFTFSNRLTNYLVGGLTNGSPYHFRLQMVDAAGNTSPGIQAGPTTPTEDAFIRISSHISTDARWAAGVFVVAGDIQVRSGATLTIDRGVIVKFEPGSSLRVQSGSRLIANGVAGDEIVFTSVRDDSVGGDTNGDGDSSAPAANDWENVMFSDAADGNRMSHFVLRYAGSRGIGGLYSERSSVAITDCSISSTSSYGIYFYQGGASEISRCDISNTTHSGIYAFQATMDMEDNEIFETNHGIEVYSGTTEIIGNTLRDNRGHGVFFHTVGATSVLEDNVITRNVTPVRVPFSAMPGLGSGNVMTDNSRAVIEVYGATRNDSLEVTPSHVIHQYSGNSTLSAGVVLRVQPGVVWKFTGGRLDIYGALYAVGTAEEPIYFTSYRDDAVGGDTNNNGTTTGVAGDWDRLYVRSQSLSFLTRLEHVHVRYGDGLLIENSPINVVDSRIDHSAQQCVYVDRNAPVITNTYMGDCRHDVIYAQSASPVLIGNTMERGTNGLNATWSTATLENNIFRDNRDWGVWFNQNTTMPVMTGNTVTGNLRSVHIPISGVPNTEDGNTFVPNEIDGLFIRGGTRSTPLRLSVQTVGDRSMNSYYFENVTMNAPMVIDPGVVLKFPDGHRLTMQDTLTAVGTAAEPIYFTSYRDDAIGGDMNNDGTSTPYAGAWRNVWLNNSDGHVIDHAEFRFCGSSTACLDVDNATLTLSNSTIMSSRYQGIDAWRSSTTMTNVDVLGHRGHGIYLHDSGTHDISNSRIFGNIGDGIQSHNTVVVTARNVEFFANGGNHIRHNGNQPMDAQQCWWGDPVGPADRVSGNVDTTNFLNDGTEYSWLDAGPNETLSYGINTPVYEGLTSTVWGTGVDEDVLYDAEDQQLTVSYNGMDENKSFRALVGYYNGDARTTVQTLTDFAGQVIHGPMPLPTGRATRFQYGLPRAAGGQLQLLFTATQGERALLSSILLFADNSVDTTAPTVTIARPEASDILSADTHSIGGVVSDDDTVVSVEVGIEKDGALTWHRADNFSNGHWQFRWNPSEGVYTLRARALDQTGNLGVASPVTVTVDTTPPLAPTNLRVNQVAGALRATWSRSFEDASGQNGVVRYDILRSTRLDDEYVAIGQVPAGVAQYDDLNVQNGELWHYRVRAVDAAGNTATSSPYGPVEVNQSFDDTPPEEASNLTAQASHLDGVTSAFLRWSGSPDSDGDLIGYRISVSADNGTTWGSLAPAFNNNAYTTVGTAIRSHQIPGLSVGSTYTFRIQAVDASQNVSAGITTDLTVNGGEFIELSGNIQGTTTLGAGVYVFNSVTVPQGAQLLFGPGAIIKMRSNTRLNVQGLMRAVGSEQQPVVFTAFDDDSIGGDTNGDGFSESAPGYWRGIYFYNTADHLRSLMQFAEIRFGGRSGQASLSVEASMEITDTRILDGDAYGIYVHNSTPTFRRVEVRNHRLDGVYLTSANAHLEDCVVAENDNHGVFTQFSHPGFEGCEITDNAKYGIYYAYAGYSVATFNNNTITGNHTSVRIPVNGLTGENNVLTPNTRAVVEISGQTVSSDLRLSVLADDTPDRMNTYYLISDMTMAGGTRIEFDPGVVMKFGANARLTVRGEIAARGTLAQKVVFTSYKDEQHGYDLTSDSTLPVSGEWDGVYLNRDGFAPPSRLEHTIIRYADYNLYVQNGFQVLSTDCELTNAQHDGLYAYIADVELIGCRIWGNSGDGAEINHPNTYVAITFSHISSNGEDGVEIHNSGRADLQNNRFFQNGSRALNNRTGNVIDAGQSWWGDNDGSGPYHADDNPNGIGDGVSDNVTFLPFVVDPPFEYGYRNFSASAPSTAGGLPAPTVTFGTIGEESDAWDAQARPPYTMAFDNELVQVSFTGLDPNRRYKARVTYYNGDATNTNQSLADGEGRPIHPSYIMPRARPVQYEFPIAQAYTSSGEMQLNVVNENPNNSIRGAISQVWMIEDLAEVSPPRFELVSFNDVDGSGTLTVGDEYHFQFSEAMDTTNTVADAQLVMVGGGSYGNENQVAWSPDERVAVVTLNEGFTVNGDEQVTPVDMFDPYGNAVVGTQVLSDIDTVAPTFLAIDWVDVDDNGQGSLGDQHIFRFSEAMDTTIIEGGVDANTHLRPQGSRRYGSTNVVEWSADRRSVTVTMTEGYTIQDNELVVPTRFVTDVAGNSVVGTQNLSGRDEIAPEMLAIRFNDANGNGAVSLGDSFTFVFSEPMRTAPVSNGTTEANINLSPAGRRYGTVNQARWNADNTEVTVTVTPGFTIVGNEQVAPAPLIADVAGNTVINGLALNVQDVQPPSLVEISPRYISPLSPVSDYRLTLRFNSAMDPSQLPNIVLNNDDGPNPVVVDGEWLTTRYPNDTYTTGNIDLTADHHGILTVDVTDATDVAGNTMTSAEGAYTLDLDAIEPAAPNTQIQVQGCDAARLSWAGYDAPEDLAGFQIYREGAAFNEVDGVSLFDQIASDRREYTLTGLQLDTTYHVGVAALDRVTNFSANVVSQAVRIDQVVPPAVPVSLAAGADPTTVVVRWNGYNASAYCGLAGFRVYLQEANFNDVGALAPVSTLGAEATQTELVGLARDRVYYIAVVAFNEAGEALNAVNTREWTDPLSGAVSSDLTLGNGAQRVIDVNETMVVVGGAVVTIAPGTTVRFGPDAGIVVQDGALVAEGTVFEPILLTSQNHTPARGDWSGVELTAGAGGSILNHVALEYGEGLTIDGSSPSVENFTARHNQGSGISVSGGNLDLSDDTLLTFNDTGMSVGAGGNFNITGSVIKNNTVNALNDGGTLTAEGNWWGSLDAGTIAGGVQGAVSTDNFLDYEPVLSPAVRVAGGETLVVRRRINLDLTARNAVEMRFSEDDTFNGVFFDDFATTGEHLVSSGSGAKTIYAQFRSITGTNSAPVAFVFDFDTTEPVIDNFSLEEGQVVGRPIEVVGQASSGIGLTRLDIEINGEIVSSNEVSPVTYAWDPRQWPEGIYTVRLWVYDVAENVVVVERTVFVEHQAPPQPVITDPQDGRLFNVTQINMQGTAEPNVTVDVKRDGFTVGRPVAAANGIWTLADVDLVEGTQTFVARAVDEIGTSLASEGVTVALDTGAPGTPVLTEAHLILGRGVIVGWEPPAQGEEAVRYDVYRHAVDFGSPAEAVRVAQNIEELSWLDETGDEGNWYYAVVGLDTPGNASGLSNRLSAQYDLTRPAITVSIPDQASFGIGPVALTVESSESLQQAPTLTVTPQGVGPVAVSLVEVGANRYTGVFNITGATPSGPTVLRVTATDVVGNVFSGAPVGAGPVVDTQGPEVQSLTYNVDPPVQVLDTKDVQVDLVLDEPAAIGTIPNMTYDPPIGNPVNVGLAGSGAVWRGTLRLTSAMGSGLGTFSVTAEDTFGNIRTSPGGSLEIYDDDAPNPTVPPSLTSATSRPAGAVELRWNAVPQASSYNVYRSTGNCPGDGWVEIASGINDLTYTDTPETDGVYCYGLTTDRLGAESGASNRFNVLSDRVPPEAPTNLAVVLAPAGVRVTFDASPGDEVPTRYRVLRNGDQIRSLNGGLNTYTYNDHPPAGGDFDYTIEAQDGAGNTATTAPETFSLAVGAVTQLEVLLDHFEPPLLTWGRSDPNTTGYHVERGGVRITQQPLQEPRFVDETYPGNNVVEYAVIAVNAEGQESPPRTVSVKPVFLDVFADRTVSHYFNQLQIQLINSDGVVHVDSIETQITVNGEEEFLTTDELGVDVAGAPFEFIRVFPTSANLDTRIVRVTARVNSEAATVRYRRFAAANVYRALGQLDLVAADTPVAGTLSSIEVCINNRGQAPMDVVTARENGSQPGDLTVAVTSADGQELSRGTVQTIPAGARFDGNTIFTRIPANGRTCVDVNVVVPEALEEGAQIQFVATVPAFSWARDGANIPALAQLTGSMNSSITTTAYFGTAQADRDIYIGDDTVVITGQAIDRETNNPLPNTALKVGFTTRGFSWTEDVTTDDDGNFQYNYNPAHGLAGEIVIWAAHPDVVDVLDQDRFTIYRVYTRPSSMNLRSAKADTLDFNVKVLNPGDVPLTGLQLATEAFITDENGDEQPIDSIRGSIIDLPADFEVAAGGEGEITLQLEADIDAPDHALVLYRLTSAEGAAVVVDANVTLSEAIPIINVKAPARGFVDVSMRLGEIETVPVTLTNEGLRPLENAVLTVPAVPWITTNREVVDGQVALGDIAVGESVTLDVVLTPGEDLEQGPYADQFQLTGDNSAQVFDLNVFALLTSADEGAAEFRVLANTGDPVEGAKVRLQNSAIRAADSATTDENGVARFNALSTGTWSYQVTAPGHASVYDVVEVEAEQTTVTTVELERELVSINFRVEPVPFTDRYEIKIEQTFVTNVPVPVLVIDPPFVQIDNPEPGFQTTIIAKVKNEGLKAIDDVTLTRDEIEEASLIPLIEYIPRLGAMQTVEVPFRIIYRGDQQPDQPACTVGDAGSAGQAALGIASIIAGSSRSDISGAEKRAAATLTTALLLLADLSVCPGIPGTPSLPGGGSCLAGLLMQFMPCIGSGSSDGGNNNGPSGPGNSSPGGFGPPGCFTEGTPVLMADGSRQPIESIQVGDKVAGLDGEAAEVTRTYVRESSHVREVRYRDEKGQLRRLETTDGHAFREKKRGWVPAGKLEVGDTLILVEGEATIVSTERYDEAVEVFNLDVADQHAYFANDAWVQQKCDAEVKLDETNMTEEEGQ
ncbi:MAG: right-handed parallel beta-helix repeat-containing protein [Bradymonadia bacterium]